LAALVDAKLLATAGSCRAPKALADKHTWDQDLCHFAPSSCNAQGHLTRLMLPVLGMRCPAFPSKLARLPALTQLDLSGNSFGEVRAEEVARVRWLLARAV